VPNLQIIKQQTREDDMNKDCSISKFLKICITALLLAGFCASLLCGDAQAESDKYEKKRESIRKTSENILKRLYKASPNAESAIEDSFGYAVFSNFGLKIFIAGGGKGSGVAINNKTKEEIFMNMLEIQAGLGMGAKKFSLVWVFETESGFDQFVNSGWELGAQASAAAKAGDDVGGSLQGAMAVAPGVWLYQLTDAGLALELTAKGTKYYKNKKLNE
jgi:lipid-binding SYLF domain-containing protein